MTEPIEIKKSIEFKELMTLSAFKALSEFDSSNLTVNSPKTLIDEISTQFSSQFKEYLTHYYEEEIEKLTSQLAIDHQK